MSTKRKLPQKLGQPVVKQSAKALGKGRLDESQAVVSTGGNALKPNLNGTREVVNISSDSSSDEDSEVDDESVEEDSVAGDDLAMLDAEPTRDIPPAEEEADVADQPSFGDLVRANISEPIDVAGAFEDAASQALPYPKPQVQAPSGASLGTVLAQALRTNDVALLESCFHTTDSSIIRATIQRLESPLAGKLLARLAERLHKRPGRAGSLMVWIQWTLVTHGGYLATQPDLIKKLAALNQVIDARSRGLQSVLTLKGKLDMLEAQIELRRNMQNQRRRMEEDEDEEGVIYVEGQESEEEESAVKVLRSARNNDLEAKSDAGSEISEDMPLTNGMVAESDEEEDSSEEDLIDDEAEETDNDSKDEDEVDHDDLDSMDEDEESDDGVHMAPPSKMAKISGQFSKKR